MEDSKWMRKRLLPHTKTGKFFYKTDNGDIKVEILLFQENLWLTQAKIAELFEVQKAAISKHLKNIFASGELNEASVVSKMETTDCPPSAKACPRDTERSLI